MNEFDKNPLAPIPVGHLQSIIEAVQVLAESATLQGDRVLLEHLLDAIALARTELHSHRGFCMG